MSIFPAGWSQLPPAASVPGETSCWGLGLQCVHCARYQGATQRTLCWRESSSYANGHTFAGPLFFKRHVCYALPAQPASCLETFSSLATNLPNNICITGLFSRVPNRPSQEETTLRASPPFYSLLASCWSSYSLRCDLFLDAESYAQNHNRY